MFCILTDCSIMGDIPCVVQSCMRDPTVELWHQTCIDGSHIEYRVHDVFWYLVHNYAWLQNSRTLWLHNRHQTMTLLRMRHHFQTTKLASYTKYSSFQLIVYANIKIVNKDYHTSLQVCYPALKRKHKLRVKILYKLSTSIDSLYRWVCKGADRNENTRLHYHWKIARKKLEAYSTCFIVR